MDWIGAKMDWIKKIRFFAHLYYLPRSTLDNWRALSHGKISRNKFLIKGILLCPTFIS